MKKLLWIILIVLFTGCSDAAAYAERTVDVDLTALNSNMRSAEITNMYVNEPSRYIGKTIRASGIYLMGQNPENNEMLHIIYVEMDNCCAPSPILFFPNEDFSFPEYGEQIEIIGEFNEYNGFDYNYYCLTNASEV